MESSYCVEDLASYTKNLVKYVLNTISGKLPIKRSDIVGLTTNDHPKLFSKVLSDAKRVLTECYGLDLIEVPDSKSVKLYIAVSTVNSGSELDFDEKQRGHITLLFLILTYIFMKGHSITEENLWQHLSKLKIAIDEPHPVFGPNIKKLISETFVKQLYLKREKLSAVGAVEDEINYSWGFRSTYEFPKKRILEEAAKIIGKSPVCFVRQQMEISGMDVNDVEMV